ncbi:MAG: EAL domain-containing protein [Sulfurimonas sp.]|uniref:EAL domain-containing protein n=1 Tax=Sulfurimonas sp. TaxID=2022749 RepID=UPI002639CAA6|nr:EAL domain-containing protein [Sulfurimonas sp.]MDD2652503.1 EAL domain-containing protein [Sulfurimonas sp.]MDD3452240.1 EAL domain-containing protein [Sulfurimonas sp.]
MKLIPLLFLFIGAIKIAYIYSETKAHEAEFAKKEAEVLNSYAVENRNYYQQLFLDKTLDLNEKTLPALPAFSSHPISGKFSQNNPLRITLATVSDRARNPKNQANDEEQKAITFFKENPNEDIYFNEQNKEFYQYASVLRVTPVCLKCHGEKEKAPLYIQERYDGAYDYQLGDVRGIISIQIPKDALSSYFFKDFFKTASYDFFLFLLLFLGITYLLNYSKKINDVLENKIRAKTDELRDSFFKDRLTNLPNRLKLIEDIERLSPSSSMHLALINIDAFKDINDLYGYNIGDAVLVQVSRRIREFCTDKNMVYKLPNDEFAIFTTLEVSEEEFFLGIKNLLNTIGKNKFEERTYSIFLSFSCGIASNKEALLIKANTALQTAKNNAKNIVVYRDSLDAKEQITKNADALLLLKEAIAHDRITPFFQPIYNTRSKRIEKYESLARIIKEDKSIIMPFAFLDISIKSKLYPEITKAMILKTFAFFKETEYEFSINLSILDIQNQEILKFILAQIQTFKSPQRIVFEILESHKIENYQEMKGFIKEIKKHGCKIAIDDFGSGYSNFSHIFELNVDYLKIDGSLVKFITTDESSRVIVKTIVNFASNLGLKTIAEFVEDRDSLELLEKMGVDFVQGYYIGKPSSTLCEDFKHL